MEGKVMNKKGFLHGLLMMACCIVPMLLLVAFLPQLKTPAANSASGFNWIWLIILLCPLMHIFMMKAMHGKGESCHDRKEENMEKAVVSKDEAR